MPLDQPLFESLEIERFYQTLIIFEDYQEILGQLLVLYTFDKDSSDFSIDLKNVLDLLFGQISILTESYQGSLLRELAYDLLRSLLKFLILGQIWYRHRIGIDLDRRVFGTLFFDFWVLLGHTDIL